MAVIQFGGDSHVSKPTKRLRWATVRHKGEGGITKRRSIMNRFHHGPHVPMSEKQQREGLPITGEQKQLDRKIFFNIPLPDNMKDEQGHPLAQYGRNKIRTAKYTALSFIPKNLFFQFHNIANMYFFFIIILSVSLFSADYVLR